MVLDCDRNIFILRLEAGTSRYVVEMQWFLLWSVWAGIDAAVLVLERDCSK
jgi:hypothetical protein